LYKLHLKKQKLKPGNHLIGMMVETRRFQAINWIQLDQLDELDSHLYTPHRGGGLVERGAVDGGVAVAAAVQ
jgi:hypothetical protein